MYPSPFTPLVILFSPPLSYVTVGTGTKWRKHVGLFEPLQTFVIFPHFSVANDGF